MDKWQIEAIVRDIIAGHLEGVAADTVDKDTEFAVMGVDSLAFSWILADLEDAFDFTMRGSELMECKTLAATVEYVAGRLAAK